MTIAANTLEGTSTTLTDADIDNLRRSVRGELVVAGEARYDEARRVWNGNVDRRPALIVRCLGAADVSAQEATFSVAISLKEAVQELGRTFTTSRPGVACTASGPSRRSA